MSQMASSIDAMIGPITKPENPNSTIPPSEERKIKGTMVQFSVDPSVKGLEDRCDDGGPEEREEEGFQ